MIFCATFSVYRGFPIGRDRSRKIIIFPKREIRPGNCRLRKQEKSRNVRVKFCSWIELKERKQRDGDRDKINEKKKRRKMEKIFPSCVHVRFERGRIQHSRVPFSSGVALRCHTFSTLDAETYTFAPVHIVVCLQRLRERKQPRGWSLEKKTRQRLLLFSNGFIPRCLTYSSTSSRGLVSVAWHRFLFSSIFLL